MAVITRMPNERIISGFRGIIDFYYYMGLSVVRKWPRSPGKRRSPAVEAQWVPFKEAAALAKELSATMIEFYRENASTSHMHWKDLFFRSYLSGLPTEVYQGEE